MAEKLIFKGSCIIQKAETKGAWTYVMFDAKIPQTGLPFGWIIVKGKIDNYEIQQFKLWPTKGGKVFMPLKTAIRKSIRKDKGDSVDVAVYLDDSHIEIPHEFIDCISESPMALAFFNKISNTSQKQYIDWVYETKSLETRANRIAKAIRKMELGLKYHEKL